MGPCAANVLQNKVPSPHRRAICFVSFDDGLAQARCRGNGKPGRGAATPGSQQSVDSRMSVLRRAHKAPVKETVMNRTIATAFFAVASLLTAGSVSAQSSPAQANIPFNLAVGNTVLPAGTYTVSSFPKPRNARDSEHRPRAAHNHRDGQRRRRTLRRRQLPRVPQVRRPVLPEPGSLSIGSHHRGPAHLEAGRPRQDPRSEPRSARPDPFGPAVRSTGGGNRNPPGFCCGTGSLPLFPASIPAPPHPVRRDVKPHRLEPK